MKLMSRRTITFALLAAGAALAPAATLEAQTATADAPYQTDEQWLNAATDPEDYASGDVSEYRGEVRQANRELDRGVIDLDEYWEEIRQAKALLGSDDDHGLAYPAYSTYGYEYPYYYGPYGSYYLTDDYGAYDAAYDWETDDADWDGWFEDDEWFEDDGWFEIDDEPYDD